MAKQKRWFATAEGHQVARDYEGYGGERILTTDRYTFSTTFDILQTVSKYAGSGGLSTSRLSREYANRPSDRLLTKILSDLERRGLIEKGSPDYESRLAIRRHQYDKTVQDIVGLRSIAEARGPRLSCLFRERTARWLSSELRCKDPTLDPEIREGRIKDLSSQRCRLRQSIAYLEKKVAEQEKEGG